MRDTIEMARESGALQIGFNKTISQSEYSLFEHELKAFEALVRADEREACARVCENSEIEGSMGYGQICAEIIRARGQRSDEASIRGNT